MSRKKTGGSRGSKPTQHPEHDYVSVYCSGTAKRAHPKWKIATFITIARDDGAVWVVDPSGYTEPLREGQVLNTPIADKAFQWLVGTEWLPKDRHPFFSKPDGYRERWNLTCRECGLAKIIAAPDEFYLVLDSLNFLGVREVELHHFANSESSISN
ncbi:hypothetical protein [Cryobacterium sp. M91]|uniref:hypothetical protein n=1 Tax=Cryobacterium sp. M91 TaxID=2048294 RepID=UPI0011B06691|nr:hypothetical protein [Cryobacterium sp. M91]